MSRMSIAYGGIIAFFFRGMNLVVALGTLLLTSRELGKAENDAFVLGITVVGLANALTGGLTAATAYQVANKRRPAGAALGGGLAPAAVVSAVFLLAGAVVAATATGYLGDMALPIGAAASAVVLNSVLAGVLLGRESFVRYNLALVSPPLFALISLAAMFLLVDDPTPRSTITAYAVGQAAGFAAIALTSLPLLLDGFAFSRALGLAIVAFGAFAALSSGISYLNYRADLFVVKYFEGAGGVATYGYAVYLGESIWQVSGSLTLATYARLGTLNRPEAARLTARVMRHTILLLGILCVALFVLADAVEWVLFPDYGGVSSALRFLLPGVLLYSLAQAFSGFYTYRRGLPWAAAIVAGTGLVLDMLFAVILVPRMGVNGAALASTLAYSLTIVAALTVFIRQERLHPADIFRFGRDDLDDYRTLLTRIRTTLGGHAPPNVT
jgi:O-antigen/teichoic acid export membrane protein